MKTGALVVLLAVACAGPPARAPEESAASPGTAAPSANAAAVAETSQETREPAPAPASGKDPASCVDEGFAAWLPRTEEVNRQVDERLEKLGKCGVTRDERLAIAFYFEPGGKLVRNPVALSTVRDCKVSECVRKVLADIRVSPAEKDGSPYWVSFALAPNAPAQRVTWTAFEGAGWSWSKCGDEKERAKLPESLFTGELRGVVIANSTEFASCYERGLARDETLKGRVEVLFVLEADGSASSVKISGNSIADCSVVECTRQVFSRLKFPASKASRQYVHFPIKYQPPP